MFAEVDLERLLTLFWGFSNHVGLFSEEISRGGEGLGEHFSRRARGGRLILVPREQVTPLKPSVTFSL